MKILALLLVLVVAVSAAPECQSDLLVAMINNPFLPFLDNPETQGSGECTFVDGQDSCCDAATYSSMQSVFYEMKMGLLKIQEEWTEVKNWCIQYENESQIWIANYTNFNVCTPAEWQANYAGCLVWQDWFLEVIDMKTKFDEMLVAYCFGAVETFAPFLTSFVDYVVGLLCMGCDPDQTNYLSGTVSNIVLTIKDTNCQNISGGAFKSYQVIEDFYQKWEYYWGAPAPNRTTYTCFNKTSPSVDAECYCNTQIVGFDLYHTDTDNIQLPYPPFPAQPNTSKLGKEIPEAPEPDFLKKIHEKKAQDAKMVKRVLAATISNAWSETGYDAQSVGRTSEFDTTIPEAVSCRSQVVYTLYNNSAIPWLWSPVIQKEGMCTNLNGKESCCDDNTYQSIELLFNIIDQANEDVEDAVKVMVTECGVFEDTMRAEIANISQYNCTEEQYLLYPIMCKETSEFLLTLQVFYSSYVDALTKFCYNFTDATHECIEGILDYIAGLFCLGCDPNAAEYAYFNGSTIYLKLHEETCDDLATGCMRMQEVIYDLYTDVENLFGGSAGEPDVPCPYEDEQEVKHCICFKIVKGFDSDISWEPVFPDPGEYAESSEAPKYDAYLMEMGTRIHAGAKRVTLQYSNVQKKMGIFRSTSTGSASQNTYDATGYKATEIGKQSDFTETDGVSMIFPSMVILALLVLLF